MAKIQKALRKLKLRFLYRLLRKRRNRRMVMAGLSVVGVLLLITILLHPPDQKKIGTAAYMPLLEVIAKGESSGNYNAYYGNANNNAVHFTEMPIQQVLQWQEEYVRQGNPSSAVGRYQIIHPTLVKLIRELNVDTNLPFDQAMQDRMAIALLERRGSVDYADKKLSREQFAANIAQEWAALPKVAGPNPGDSYYAGDGLNQSRIAVDEVLGAITHLELE